MHSISEENYIKTIYHLQDDNELVSTNEIASRMTTKASSVTDMLKKLADKDLVQYIPYKGTRLTNDGISCAMKIIRKHRLWEVFLVQKLGFSWDEVHEVAEQLEHIQSTKLINKLDQLLGYPKHDPHGDPIPDAQGNYEKLNATPLSEMKVGATALIIGVMDTSSGFLQYLDKHNIQLGTQVQLLEREDYDGSCIIQTDHKQIHITQITADQLYVKPN